MMAPDKFGWSGEALLRAVSARLPADYGRLTGTWIRSSRGRAGTCRASADERRRVEFHVLGPLEVTSGGRPLSVGGARARAVLAFLLLNANAVVSADRLADELWPGLAPGRAAANLQVRLSELRRALRSVAEEDRLANQARGYVLRVAPGELEVVRFQQLAASGREALAAGDAATAVRLLDESLALWRGAALGGFGDLPFAAAEQAPR